MSNPRIRDLLESRNGVCFMTGGGIADWFTAQSR